MFASRLVARTATRTAAVRTATTTMSTVAARPATASRMGVNSVVAAMAATAAAGAFYYAQINATEAEKKPLEKLNKATSGPKGTLKERTFIMIKPDGVQRGLISDVIARFEKKGYKLVALKLLTPSKDLVEKHYEDLKGKPFYPGLVSYMSSGTPVVAMVWEGNDVVKVGRAILGATNPSDAAPGTLRFDYCLTVGRNAIHGSDAVDSAAAEIKLWFTDAEISDWDPKIFDWVNEVK